MRLDRWLSILLPVALIAACSPASDPGLPGQLEWDRIAVLAESSEAVVELAVSEGQHVAEGELLARLDPQRADIAIARTAAALAQAQARLDELRAGARSEARDAAAAAVRRAREVLAEAEREQRRVEELRQHKLVAAADLDLARSASQRARADFDLARAQLAELENGTRNEQLRHAEAAVEAAQGGLDEAQLQRSRLDLHAPRAGRIDALPFKLGDRPPQGAAVVSLLSGDTPYARVFVPATERPGLQAGMPFKVSIEGVETAFDGTLRSIASEPSFTPYYALIGDDASRLVYRAEILLSGPQAAQLPAGLPLHATASPK